MHELKPVTSTKKTTRHRRKVVICPPPEHQVEQYARAVCKQLSEKYKANYGESDVVQGFTTFVKLAVSIRARQLGATYEEEDAKERAA